MERKNFYFEFVKENYIREKNIMSFYNGLSALITSAGVSLASLEMMSHEQFFPHVLQNIAAGVLIVSSFSYFFTNIQLLRNNNAYNNELNRHT